jgi:hypothetical protein
MRERPRAPERPVHRRVRRLHNTEVAIETDAKHGRRVDRESAGFEQSWERRHE